jgi:transcriptional regulator with XRE-family HTH domain
MLQLVTPYDVLLSVASFVKETRLQQSLRAEDLAVRAGIGKATLARIEKTGICSTENLVKVFAALGKLELLASILIPEEPVSIAELRKLSRKRRKRVHA